MTSVIQSVIDNVLFQLSAISCNSHWPPPDDNRVYVSAVSSNNHQLAPDHNGVMFQLSQATITSLYQIIMALFMFQLSQATITGLHQIIMVLLMVLLSQATITSLHQIIMVLFVSVVSSNNHRSAPDRPGYSAVRLQCSPRLPCANRCRW